MPLQLSGSSGNVQMRQCPNNEFSFVKSDQPIKSLAILGGGTAGWMAAAMLANRFNHLEITLVESPELGTIGVGEATVPYIKEFLQELKIDEVDFIRHTHATYKLGIAFDGWHKPGQRFFHPFAGYGSRIARIPFHHFWTKLKQQGRARELDAYCLSSQMARHNRFALPKPNNDVELSSFNYAFHFDAGLFANYLRSWAEKKGVICKEAKVIRVHQQAGSSLIQQLQLSTGETIAADFFIDASGFRGLLIEETLHCGYEDWSHWLPCDRAIALPCRSQQPPAVFTRSLATAAGWQWRIPLQHRMGNGHVYCSRFMSDDQALALLQEQLQGEPLAEPKVIPFTTGMRKRAWYKNVFCVGLASGFLEPLESTSIYMVQSSLDIFIQHFPRRAGDGPLADQVNRQLRIRQEKLRDFLILHYHANQRIGDAFWDECRHMDIPASLSERIACFRDTGRINQDELDFFRTNSWLAMFAGFEINSHYYHPAVDEFDETMLEEELGRIARSIQQAVSGLPSHNEFIGRNCAMRNEPYFS